MQNPTQMTAIIEPRYPHREHEAVPITLTIIEHFLSGIKFYLFLQIMTSFENSPIRIILIAGFVTIFKIKRVAVQMQKAFFDPKCISILRLGKRRLKEQ